MGTNHAEELFLGRYVDNTEVRAYKLSLRDTSLHRPDCINLLHNMIMLSEVEQKRNLKLIFDQWTQQFLVGHHCQLKSNSKANTCMPSLNKFKLNLELK